MPVAETVSRHVRHDGTRECLSTDDDTLSAQRTYAVRHHQRRTSQSQNRLAGIESSIRAAPSPFVSDHHKIRISRLTDQRVARMVERGTPSQPIVVYHVAEPCV